MSGQTTRGPRELRIKCLIHSFFRIRMHIGGPKDSSDSVLSCRLSANVTSNAQTLSFFRGDFREFVCRLKARNEKSPARRLGVFRSGI